MRFHRKDLSITENFTDELTFQKRKMGLTRKPKKQKIWEILGVKGLRAGAPGQRTQLAGGALGAHPVRGGSLRRGPFELHPPPWSKSHVFS